jgi:hypothetical protein
MGNGGSYWSFNTTIEKSSVFNGLMIYKRAMAAMLNFRRGSSRVMIQVGLDQYHGDSAYDDYGLPKQVTV